MNNGRSLFGGAGTQTAALAMGGLMPAASPDQSALTELYNGTNWSAIASMNSGKEGSAGAGTSTAGLNFGAVLEPRGLTEEFTAPAPAIQTITTY